jgi:hypothetical protein
MQWQGGPVNLRGNETAALDPSRYYGESLRGGWLTLTEFERAGRDGRKTVEARSGWLVSPGELACQGSGWIKLT